MKTKFLWFLLPILVILAGAYWFWFRPIPVKTEAADYGSVAVFIYASGQVVPEEKVVVRSKDTGRIEKILVIEGQAITLGQPLVLLASDEMNAQYELAIAEQRQKESDYAFYMTEQRRYQQLMEQGAVAQRDYDKIVNQAEVARQQLIRAEANTSAFLAKKDEMTITSPFDGKVLEKLVDSGTTVANVDGILVLAKQGNLQVEGKVDELDAAKIVIGQKVLLSFDSLGGQVYQGKVATIAPRIDNATKSFKIKVDVTDNVSLQPGMSAELNILQSERSDALLIPVSAIDGNHVFIVKNGRATLRTIKTGIRDNKKAEIIEGLEKGDLVILNPADIKNGDSVTVVKNE